MGNNLSKPVPYLTVFVHLPRGGTRKLVLEGSVPHPDLPSGCITHDPAFANVRTLLKQATSGAYGSNLCLCGKLAINY